LHKSGFPIVQQVHEESEAFWLRKERKTVIGTAPSIAFWGAGARKERSRCGLSAFFPQPEETTSRTAKFLDAP
jgi:hypothetical protein